MYYAYLMMSSQKFHFDSWNWAKTGNLPYLQLLSRILFVKWSNVLRTNKNLLLMRERLKQLLAKFKKSSPLQRHQ